MIDYLVTADMIRAACAAGDYPEPNFHGQGGYQGVANIFNAAMARTHYAHSIRQIAAMVGESTQETGGFWFLTEAGGPFRYDPYRGRGYTQLTWKDNYASFGRWCARYGIVNDSSVFVNNPSTVASLTYAALEAVWEFDQTYNGVSLWTIADTSDGTWQHVSRAINTGNPYANFRAYGEDIRAACCQAVMTCAPHTTGEMTMAQIDDVNNKLAAIQNQLNVLTTVSNPSSGKATPINKALWSIWYYVYGIAKKLGVR